MLSYTIVFYITKYSDCTVSLYLYRFRLASLLNQGFNAERSEAKVCYAEQSEAKGFIS
jgi:hypothetical protein